MQVFVDESERRDYLLCAVLVEGPADPVRAALRGLLKPGQHRLHFSKEQPARRQRILSTLREIGVRSRVYSCPGTVKESRETCLSALVPDIVGRGARRLVLESRESMNHLDVLVIDAALRKHGTKDLEYCHLPPRQEPVLWAADAIAWATGAGADWRRRVDPLVDFVDLAQSAPGR
jgi:hypothetical protein